MRKKLLKGSMTIILSSLCVFIFILEASNHAIVNSSYTLTYDTLPKSFDGFNIVQLSDLHNQEFGYQNERLVQHVERLEPDIVVLTGDMVSADDTQFNEFESLIQSLGNRYPIFYIVGNHEQALDETDLMLLKKMLLQHDVVILDNESVTLTKGHDQLHLYGLWFNLRYYSDQTNPLILNDPETYYFDEDKMIELLGDKQDGFSILLAHNPVYFETYANWGADLTLSGHLHGGMVRIPFIGGIVSPEKTWFPYYDAGLYSNEQQHLIVSRGLSAGHKGFRFFNCPEVIRITLRCQ